MPILVDNGADDVRRGGFGDRAGVPPIFHGLRTLLDNVICRARRNSGQPTPVLMERWMGLGSLILKGDACVAPTRIFPGPLGWANNGVSWETLRWSARPGPSEIICGIRVMAVRSAVLGVFVAGDAGTADLRMNVLLFDPALGFWEQLVSADYCGWRRCCPAEERNGRRWGVPGAVGSIDLCRGDVCCTVSGHPLQFVSGHALHIRGERSPSMGR